LADFNAAQFIWSLRQGQDPSSHDIAEFARGLADGFVSDAQAGAFAMAVCLRGLSEQGCADLTLAMRDSGRVLCWDVDGPVLDKHSTGGVGDCVSLVLAPMLAATGIYVPMISGRGLGHTGGTLDKLDAIPGVQTMLEQSQMHDIVRRVGCVIASATADLAPADRRLYAVRDVTGTVDSVDLITASILSKKLAAGLDGLVLDVKCGTGAFMKTMDAAEQLAQSLVQVANLAGCPTIALITTMDEPIAPAAGNALEIDASLRVLTGQDYGLLREISLDLGQELLAHHMALSPDVARQKLVQILDSGQAAENFAQMIRLMGGPTGLVDNWARYLSEAPVIQEVPSPATGVIQGWNAQTLGEVVVDLGGGRRVEADKIDSAVGLDQILRIGTNVTRGQPLARVHAARMDHAQSAVAKIQAAIEISNDPVSRDGSLILARIT
jgi:thymidine phosphorylase